MMREHETLEAGTDLGLVLVALEDLANTVADMLEDLESQTPQRTSLEAFREVRNLVINSAVLREEFPEVILTEDGDFWEMLDKLGLSDEL